MLMISVHSAPGECRVRALRGGKEHLVICCRVTLGFCVAIGRDPGASRCIGCFAAVDLRRGYEDSAFVHSGSAQTDWCRVSITFALLGNEGWDEMP